MEPIEMATLDRWRSFLDTPKTIELVHIELVARGRQPLLIGTGEIRMTSLQEFSYSMTPTHGELIDIFKAIDQKQQNPYDGTARLRLFGKDARGVEWCGGWTMPQTINFKPLLIEGHLTALDITDHPTTATQSTELVFHADHLHPLARVLAVPGSPREKPIEKRFETLGSTIEFAYERAANVVSITASHSAQLQPNYTERWLTEPLRIMFGQPIVPRLTARNKGGESILWISAQPRLDGVSWSAFWTEESPSKPDSFFDCYSKLLTIIALAGDLEAHPITRFYDELAQVAKASPWTIALTLAGCIEGLAKLLRPKMSDRESQQEKQWSEQADALAVQIEQLTGRTELKNRAANAIRQTKGASTGSVLKVLQKGGIITAEQLETFNYVRNRVMHGTLLSPYSSEKGENQLRHLIDIVHALTRELFTRAPSLE
jgi:hypothetical protein